MASSSSSSGASKKSGETSQDKYIFLPPTESDEEAESNIAQREFENHVREVDARLSPEERARVVAIGDRARVICERWTRRLEAIKCVEAFSALSREEKKIVMRMKMARHSKRILRQLKNDYENCGLDELREIGHEKCK